MRSRNPFLKTPLFIRYVALFFLVLILAFSFIQVVLADPLPKAELSFGDDFAPFLGTEITFSVAFSNDSGTATDVGYGPYIDLFLPKSGADGQDPPPDDDGITFTGATYLGVDLNQFTPVNTVDCPSGTIIPHPLTGDPITCPPAPAGLASPFVWELTVLELPFGSFVPDQPAAVVEITAQMSNKADLDKPLPVLATPVFRYGSDELDNPDTDPPIVGSTATADVTPILITLDKAFSGPEQETATGPNYVRQHTITISIAPDQPLGVDGNASSNFVVTDFLPPEIQYWNNIDITTINGDECSATDEPLTDKPYNAPDNVLEITCDWIKGTGGDDLVITYDFFVPEFDADGQPILDPLNGGCVPVINDAKAEGDWDPVDTRDPLTPTISDETPEDDIFDACALVIQKGISNESPAVGDVLTYDYAIQVSDYFTLGGANNDTLQVEDVFSDGQLFIFDAYGNPNDALFSFSDRAGTTTGFFQDGVNLTVDTSTNPQYSTGGTCGDGSTALDYDLSQQLIDINTSHTTGTVIGGCVVPGSADPNDTQFPCNPDSIPFSAATGSIEYQTRIQDTYGCLFPGDPSVDQNDSLSNDVDIEGDVLDNEDGVTKTGRTVEDSTAAARIITGELDKQLYARNGVLGDMGPFASGDTVTYRITYDFPFTDFEQFRFIDFLPLPVLKVDDFDGLNSAADGLGDWSFDPTVAGPTDTPAPGVLQYGPDDTFHSLTGGNPATPPTPVITPTVASNSLIFFYGDYDNPLNPPSKIDLLFTMRVVDRPTADELFFTNQARSIEQNSSGELTIEDDIVFFQITQPVLGLTKGTAAVDNTVVSPLFDPDPPAPSTFSQGVCPSFSGTINSDALDSTPIDSNLSGVDAGDIVTMAIVVENTGSGRYGAFDVTIKDSLPAPLTTADISNLCVQLGDGTVLSSGSGYTGDLFGAGLELVDPDDSLPIPLVGALARGIDANSNTVNADGDNIAIITYDVTLPVDVEPSQVLTNEAEITNYANIGGGRNFITLAPPPNPTQDDADITLNDPALEKKLVETELENSTNNRQQVVIGELVTYEITLTVPEGTSLNAKITDTMDSGLAFVGCTDFSISSGALTSTTAFAAACSNPAVTPSGVGNIVTWDLGTLVNNNTDNSTPETITIEYDAVVLNVAGNQNIVPTTLDNSAVFSWDVTTTAGPDPQSVNADPGADAVTVIEPQLEINKSVTVDGSGTTGDAGDTVVYTIDINHTGASETDAYDMVITDTIPAKINSPTVTAVVDSAATLTPSDFTISSNELTNNVPIDMPVGRTIQIEVTGTLAVGVNPGETLTNDAEIEWTSLDGNQTDRSTFNDDSDERTGTGGVNDYNDSDDASLTIVSPTINKEFSAGNQDHTTDPNVAIGEIISYTVTITVPEGTSTGVSLVDTLDAGLAFVDCLSVTASPGLANTVGTGAFLAAEVCNDPTNPVITSSGSGDNSDGRVATWTFGDITNNNTDDNTAETITIVYQAVVLNTSSNVRNKNLNNNVVYKYGSAQLTDQAPNVIVVEPTLQVDKMATPTDGDAGDTIIMQLSIKHTGASNADAFNVVLKDDLAGTGFTWNGFLDCTFGSLTPDFCSFSGTELTVLWDTFPDDGSETIIDFGVTIDSSTGPGQTLTNTGFLEWTSLPGDVNTPQSGNTNSVERTGDPNDPGGSGGDVNNYNDQDPASVTVTGEPIKSIVATSEDLNGSTTDPGGAISELLTIGEIVRYRLSYQIPEGTAINFQLKDLVADGLTFLNDGTGKVAFIANGGGIESSTLGTSPQIVGNAPAAPTFVLPDDAVSTSPTTNEDTYNPGTDVYFKLGNLENKDNDSDKEYIVIEFNALVNNIPANTAGTDRPNQFEVFAAASKIDTSNTETVRLTEPDVSISKTATTAPTDAADTVIYEIELTNASTDNVSDAFDLVISDTLDSLLELVSVNVTATSTFTDSSTIGGQDVNVEIAQLIPGETAKVTVEAKVIATAPPNAVLPNDALLDYDTLPGPNGTAPGSGSDNETGSQTPGDTGDSDGARPYDENDPESVTLAGPQFKKLQPDPAKFTIGDVVSYTMVVSMTEGVTANSVVLDVLPPGLGYENYKIITLASESGGLLAANYNGSFTNDPPTLNTSAGDGNDISWDFGSITTAADNVSNNNTFLIEVAVAVLNASTPLTQDGDQLVNSAQYTFDGSPGGQPIQGGSATIAIVEPQITTEKSVIPASGVNSADNLLYTVKMSNSGNSTAYNVSFLDTLAQGVSFTSLIDCEDQSAAILPSQVTDNGTTVLFEGNPSGSWTIPVGDFIVCTYIATVQDSIIVDGDHTNSANADWASLDNQGPVNEGRIYDDNPDYDIDKDQDVDTAVFNVIAPTFAKTDGGTTNVKIGSVVPYTLTVNSPLGTLQSLVITDTLPTGLVFNNDAAIGSGVTPTPAPTVSVPNDGTAPVEIVWNFGNAVVSSSPFEITFTATVAGNATPGTKTNNAEMTYVDAQDQPQSLTDSDNVTVLIPDIQIEKTVYFGHDSGASCPGGELVQDVSGVDITYCFVVTNTGNTYLDTVVIDDTDLGIVDSSGLTQLSGSTPLAPSAQLVYYVEETLNGDLTNTAEVDADATDMNGVPYDLFPGDVDVEDDDTAEVQDFAGETDYGDLPDSLGTTLTNNGARHAVGSTTTNIPDANDAIWLGTIIDTSEPDGQPSVGADGDNILDANDEDGVSSPSYADILANAGSTVQFTAEVSTNDANTEADLGLWVDWDGDGVFDDFYSLDDVTAGNQNFTVNVPNGFQTGDQILYRVRAFPADFDPLEADAIGFAVNGEVEDYAINPPPGIDIQKTVYFGHNSGASCPGDELRQDVTNAPVTYCFEVTNTGETYLDTIVITDINLGISSASGMTLLSGATPLAPDGKLVYYYDGTISGDLVNTAEVAADATDSSGTSLPYYPAEEDVNDNDDAEVQDFGEATDYGDLPDNLGTTLASDGARHAVGPTTDGVPDDNDAIWLGTLVDTSEADGQPTSDASGDNILDDDDEDGVSSPSYNDLVPNATVQFTATVTMNDNNNTADLGLWIDWDNDGSFDDFYPLDDVGPGEQIFNVTVPSDFTTGDQVLYRVRAFPADFNPENADSTGFSDNGEVEDYTIDPPPTAVNLVSTAALKTSQTQAVMIMVLIMGLLSTIFLSKRRRQAKELKR